MPNGANEWNRFNDELAERHKERMARAKADGETFGTVDLPHDKQEHPPPTENLLHNEYQTDISDLRRHHQPEIETSHVYVMAAEKKRDRPDEVWEKETTEKLRVVEEEAAVMKEQLLERHRTKLSTHNDYVANQIQTPYNTAKEELTEAQKKAGRKDLDIWLESKWLYLAFLAIIGLSEYPLNYRVFGVLGEGNIQTMLMAGTLVVGIPLMGHFAGLTLKRRNQAGPAGKVNWRIFTTSTLLAVALCVTVGALRLEFTQKPLLENPEIFGTFFLVGMVLYGVAVLLSYGHHDESPELVPALKRYEKAEAKYSKAKPEAEQERLALMSSLQDALAVIDKDLRNKRTAIEGRRSAADDKANETLAHYETWLGKLKAQEDAISWSYNQAVQMFRTMNVKYRTNHQEPDCFKIAPRPLEMFFHNYEELDPNPMKGGN